MAPSPLPPGHYATTISSCIFYFQDLCMQRNSEKTWPCPWREVHVKESRHNNIMPKWFLQSGWKSVKQRSRWGAGAKLWPSRFVRVSGVCKQFYNYYEGGCRSFKMSSNDIQEWSKQIIKLYFAKLAKNSFACFIIKLWVIKLDLRMLLVAHFNTF